MFGFIKHPRLMKLIQRAARAHLHRQVRDPELRRKLTPGYTIGCKRILISNDFYPALARTTSSSTPRGWPRSAAAPSSARRAPSARSTRSSSAPASR